MRSIKVLVLLILIAFGAVSACCFGSGGGGSTEVKTQTSTTTLGQELIDLDKAHKDGVISEKEYKRAKKELLKK